MNYNQIVIKRELLCDISAIQNSKTNCAVKQIGTTA